MNTAQRFFISSLLLTAMSTALHAEIKLPAIISDHMVLQRDSAVPIWGWAKAGEKVSVSFGEQKKSATAGADGKWSVKLDALKADDKASTLSVSVDGGEGITVKDVLVGEVWLGSGQSNMAMTVNRSQDYEKEQAAANLPDVRMFKESSNGSPTAQAEGKGTWVVCSADTVGLFSATAYFFGRELHQTLKVPMGLINSSVGGTPIEAWIDPGAQQADPKLKGFFEGEKKPAPTDEAAEKAKYEEAMAKWKIDAAKAKAEHKRVPRPPQNAAEARTRRGSVGGLFNGKIAPLIPFAIRGAIWYQGEANSNGTKATYYQHQLPLLITDWRKRWGYDFPFAWVQLPDFSKPGEGWSAVREGMLKTLSVPHTGMAVTIGLGEERNIHPKNKQGVGKRLAAWALGSVYGEKIATSGPIIAKHEIKGGDVLLSFTHTDGGLKAEGGALQGFVIAGEDKQWHPATAKITGEQVTVSCPDVAKPVAVRYAWKDLAQPSLFNGAGLPASPFRTDDWPLQLEAVRPLRKPVK